MFILGIDALEYTLIERWNLESLKQREYGKIKVPLDRVPIPDGGYRLQPKSPTVWASFLTGELTRRDFTYQSYRGIISKILSKLREYIPLSLGLGRKVGSIYTFSELDKPTFLDIEGAYHLNAPYYGYDGSTMRLMIGLRGKTLSEKRKKLRLLYKKRKNSILSWVKQKLANQNYSVIFAYMHILDAIQHVTYLRPDFIKQIYYDLDYFTCQLKDIINDEMIIVSDHGFELDTGFHSLHAFYSSSAPLNSKPKKITEFCQIITKCAGLKRKHPE